MITTKVEIGLRGGHTAADAVKPELGNQMVDLVVPMRKSWMRRRWRGVGMLGPRAAERSGIISAARQASAQGRARRSTTATVWSEKTGSHTLGSQGLPTCLA